MALGLEKEQLLKVGLIEQLISGRDRTKLQTWHFLHIIIGETINVFMCS